MFRYIGWASIKRKCGTKFVDLSAAEIAGVEAKAREKSAIFRLSKEMCFQLQTNGSKGFHVELAECVQPKRLSFIEDVCAIYEFITQECGWTFSWGTFSQSAQLDRATPDDIQILLEDHAVRVSWSCTAAEQEARALPWSTTYYYENYSRLQVPEDRIDTAIVKKRREIAQKEAREKKRVDQLQKKIEKAQQKKDAAVKKVDVRLGAVSPSVGGIDISGLDKRTLFAHLYAHAAIAPGDPEYSSKPLEELDFQHLEDRQWKNIWYYRGRHMFVDLSGDVLDATDYDKHAVLAAKRAANIISRLRSEEK